MLHDRVHFMMSFLFASYIEKYRESDFSMPYACGTTKVFFRAGAIEYLEALLDEFYLEKARKIQAWYRKEKAQRMYQKLKSSAILLQSASRRKVCSSVYQKQKRGAILLQSFHKGKEKRLAYETLRRSARVLQACIRSSQGLKMKRQKGAVRVQTFYRSAIAKETYQTSRNSAIRLQTFVRSHFATKRCMRKRHALAVIRGFFVAVLARKQFRRLRGADVDSKTHIRRAGSKKKSDAVSKSVPQTNDLPSSSGGGESDEDFDELYERCFDSSYSDRMEEELPVAQEMGSLRGNNQFSGSVSVVSSVASGERSGQLDQLEDPFVLDSGSVVLTHYSESGSEYRRRITDLKEEIMHVTEEADLHTQEIEREFDERLAEYEQEVLDLREVLRQSEEEKIKMKKELKSVKENNVKAILRLQQAIQETGSVRRECLIKITSVLDDANETRTTESSKFARELKLLKRDHDVKVRQLENVIRQLEEEVNKQRSSDKKVPEEVHRLARKLERLFSSEHILSVVDRARDRPDLTVSIVEGSISSKCRRTLYCLEDVVGSFVGRRGVPREPKAKRQTAIRTVEDRDDEAIGLQNQLVRAYEDIERLQLALERALTDSGL